MFDTQAKVWISLEDTPDNWAPRLPSERTYDRPKDGKTRPPSKLPAIVDLFGGNRCTRCNAIFDLTLTDAREHREWHEWLDENQRVDDTPLERSYYEAITAETPSRAALERHRQKFMRKQRLAQAAHNEAVDEILALYSASKDQEAKELRTEGHTLAEISSL